VVSLYNSLEWTEREREREREGRGVGCNELAGSPFVSVKISVFGYFLE
jgi:hypothetical protein